MSFYQPSQSLGLYGRYQLSIQSSAFLLYPLLSLGIGKGEDGSLQDDVFLSLLLSVPLLASSGSLPCKMVVKLSATFCETNTRFRSQKGLKISSSNQTSFASLLVTAGIKAASYTNKQSK